MESFTKYRFYNFFISYKSIIFGIIIINLICVAQVLDIYSFVNLYFMSIT